MDDLDEVSEVQTRLAERAVEHIDEDTTTLELLERLDVSRYRHHDSSPEWAESVEFAPMYRAVLLRELEGYTDPELHRKLGDPEVATVVGFDPDDLPNRSTFYRARTNRFASAMDRIKRSAEQIRSVARECGSPIGPELMPEESTGSSKRTERRMLRKRTRQVLDEMEGVVFPALDIPRPENAIYGEDELLVVEALTGMLDDVGANEAAEIHSDMCDPEADLDASDPFYEDGPTGETLLHALKELNPRDISEMVNRAAHRCITRIKPYAEFEYPVMVAIDITYVAYYGDRDEMVQVQGAPDGKEYDWCHKYATANIVGENSHFVAGMVPVGEPSHREEGTYPGADASYRVGEVVRQLLDVVTDIVDVHRVYADKEFFAADTVDVLEESDLKYVIPVAAKRLKHVSRDVEEVTVYREVGFYGIVQDETTRTRRTTTAVVLPPDEDRDESHMFATNLPVDDEIGLDRRRTKRKIERYRKRSGIETAYKKIKEFVGMTTSRSYPVRLFHFGFGTLLYNMWLLVDFLVQSGLDVPYRSKPRVTAERFREFLKRELERRIPG